MFKGILTLAITAAISATAFGAAEVKMDREAGKSDRERARGNEAGQVSGKAANREAVRSAVARSNTEAANFLAKNLDILDVVSSVEVLKAVESSVFTLPLLKIAAINKNSAIKKGAIQAVLELGSRVGMDKMEGTIMQIKDIESSEAALSNYAKLLHYSAVILKTKGGLQAVTKQLTAKAIRRIRSGNFEDAKPEDLATAEQLMENRCVPQGA